MEERACSSWGLSLLDTLKWVYQMSSLRRQAAHLHNTQAQVHGEVAQDGGSLTKLPHFRRPNVKGYLTWKIGIHHPTSCVSRAASSQSQS